MHKDALRTQFHALPEQFSDLLDVELPQLGNLTLPTTEEDANIACGQLATYLLEVFSRLGGLPVLQVPLRVSQFVPALHAIAAAGLMFVGCDELHTFTVLSPDDGHIVAPYDTVVFQIQITHGLADFLSASLEVGGSTFLLDEGAAPDIFEYSMGFTEDGEYSCTLTVVFENPDSGRYTTEKTVTVSVITPP